MKLGLNTSTKDAEISLKSSGSFRFLDSNVLAIAVACFSPIILVNVPEKRTSSKKSFGDFGLYKTYTYFLISFSLFKKVRSKPTASNLFFASKKSFKLICIVSNKIVC